MLPNMEVHPFKLKGYDLNQICELSLCFKFENIISKF
jgi:hypothetical protein